MRPFVILMVGLICLAFTSCPKEPEDNVVNDQAGMKQPDMSQPADSTTAPAPPAGDAVTPPPAEGETPPTDGVAPPPEGEAPPAEGETPPAEGETPPAEPPAEGGQ